MDVARETVELSDYQRRPVFAAEGEGIRQLWTIGFPAALDFDELHHNLGVVVSDEVMNGGTLRIQS